MNYRLLALAIAALSSAHITTAAAQSVYVAPGAVYIGGGPVYVNPAPSNGYGYGKLQQCLLRQRLRLRQCLLQQCLLRQRLWLWLWQWLLQQWLRQRLWLRPAAGRRDRTRRCAGRRRSSRYAR
jgi:hypothetical protein